MPKTADVRAVGEVAASRHGVVTTSQAAEVNISKRVLDRLVRDGVLDHIRPNVYRFVACQRTWRQRLMLAIAGRRAAVSHYSAAALETVDGYDVAPLTVEVTCHHRHRVHADDATVHLTRWLPKADVTTIDGIACTTLARTVIDLRPFVGHDGMMRMLDDLQRRDVSLQWVMQRADKLATRGRSGAREVLDECRRRLGGDRVPDSWFERLLEGCLASPLLSGMVRQHELHDRHGNFVARFDLAIPWVRLGIEGHSRHFHFGKVAEAYDEDRDMRIAKCGWDAQYLGFAATKSPERVRQDIEEIVLQRAADLGLSPSSLSD